MRAMIRALIRYLLCLFLAAPLAPAQAAPPEAIPEQTGLVVDLTGLLDDDAQSALLARLGEFQNTGRAQVAILVARDTGGLPLADYSLQVAQGWKLGHAGRDDGMLILLVPGIAAARIEVGYGLEGAVPDARAARWIDEILIPAMKDKQLVQGLHDLLDELNKALPAAEAPKPADDHLLDRHPEWKLPFVLTVFSPFALFPLFAGRWGSVASAPLFAAFLGTAAWMLWNSQPAAIGVGAVAFVLPLLWSLNGRRDDDDLPRWLERARDVGNAAAVAIFFSFLMLFLGVGLSSVPEAAWGAPLFAGAMALGLAAVLFPGRPAQVLMIVLRSFMHFLFILAFAYPALMAVVEEPAKVAFAVSGTFTALVALSLYLDSREKRRAQAGEAVTRWSLWLVGLALLVILPVALLMLVQAILGEDFQTQLTRAAAGGGSLGAALWWAARHGFFAALKIGLGGKFGGGGAEGRG
jgi:uncharacterized protein